MSGENKPTEDRSLPRFRPATDILERPDGFYLYLDLPGVNRKDLKVDIKGAEMVVSGRACYPAGPEEKLLESEFGSAEYVCSFTISDIVDVERITANLRNGVLEIFMPKAASAEPRRIQVEYEDQ